MQVCGLVLVHLAREDSVAATTAYNELGGYCDPDLNGALQTILAAFEEEDAEGAKEALNRPCLKDLVKINVKQHIQAQVRWC